MIYFDNAATGGRKPDAVVRAVRASIDGPCGNPGRSGHALSVALAENVLRCRKLLCEFLGGESSERVILTKNCTEALNIALFGLLRPPQGPPERPPHVVSTEAEHNAVLRPLLFLERNGYIRLTLVRPQAGRVSPAAIAAAVQKDTAAAVFTLASNVTGSAIDPAAVRALLPARVLTVCDGAQACGHTAVQMRADGIDLLAAAGHKGLHGIQGSGALLLSARAELFPYAYGGTGTDSADPDMPPFCPERLEAGTLSCPAAASLAEGALYLLPRRAAVAARLHEMTGALLEGLRAVPGIRVYSEANACGIAAFGCEALSSELFAQRLSDEYGIAVRGGLHCAPRMHAALGTLRTGLVRASLSEFNTEGEISDFLRAVRAIAASP